ncbi:receptor-like serine/threonine-protein kinase SD1-8-like protein [Trifolium pratense]|uniref:Receptor-like serine/threonine-protein kinase SD1-8-like protein n=1 Tax=Trifolium pratense TaxID=57577 RepID=A0A2K3LDY3_TRIPR|nr:receptor-like serine/threonine-protein kinase SD1-8-like protein [Trifolium pratense]
MPSVLLMLSSETALMPEPRSPGFSLGGRSMNPPETDSSSSKQDETWSVNQVTVTLLDARLFDGGGSRFNPDSVTGSIVQKGIHH